MGELNGLTVDVETYLKTLGVLPESASPAVERLGGGVSNTVLKVTSETTALVLKRPLENLAVEDDWPADVVRVHNEAAAARAYSRIGECSRLTVRVPDVLFEDREKHVIGIECAPEPTTMWKQQLLDGTVDADIAAGLGEFLARSQTRMAGDSTVRTEFEHDRPFEQLRLDPYHRTVADRHPDVAQCIRPETDRISGVSRTLVHGDFSPKNVLVAPGEPSEVWLLDFEVAHWGDPAFDAAFLLNHLCIKSVYNHGQQQAYLDAATAFWDVYTDHVDWELEERTTRELAILMLARVDGKSPVEYLTDERQKDALRSVAKRALQEDVTSLDRYKSLLRAVTCQ